MSHSEFSYHIANFFTKHLPGRKGASPHTVSSYRDSIVLFLQFMNEVKETPAEKLDLSMVKKEHVEDYLNWLEDSRKCTSSTRNVRLAALHAFFRYMQYECPDRMNEWQEILSIPKKKAEKKVMEYASPEGIKLLLQMPEQTTPSGRRDLALLSLMYDSGARVQEMADLTSDCIRLKSPSTVKLTGKGNKARIVPLMNAQVDILNRYMEERGLLAPEKKKSLLFVNQQGKKLTRAGISYIVKKYAKKAHAEDPLLFPEHFSCHCLRHSKAMHMLQADVNLVYIRDFLGHTSVQTTEVYARADSNKKREALEKAYKDVLPQTDSLWQGDKDLLAWLKNL